MKNRFIRLLLLSLALLASSAKAEQRCEDFLAKLGDKPEFVEFLQCTQHNEAQGKPLIARYRVKGSNALQAERYMSQRFGLPTLRYICCGWDSTPYFYRDRKTHLGYMLGMGSEETPVNKRDSWQEIDFFHISMSLFTEDP